MTQDVTGEDTVRLFKVGIGRGIGCGVPPVEGAGAEVRRDCRKPGLPVGCPYCGFEPRVAQINGGNEGVIRHARTLDDPALDQADISDAASGWQTDFA